MTPEVEAALKWFKQIEESNPLGAISRSANAGIVLARAYEATVAERREAEAKALNFLERLKGYRIGKLGSFPGFNLSGELDEAIAALRKGQP